MAGEHVVPVFFLSGSTGISAETMGNVLLIQFPDLHFERRLFPVITTVKEARLGLVILDCAMVGPVPPLVFSTAAVDEIREVLLTTRCPIIDFFGLHMQRVRRRSACVGRTWAPGRTGWATFSAITTGCPQSSSQCSTTTDRVCGRSTRPRSSCWRPRAAGR